MQQCILCPQLMMYASLLTHTGRSFQGADRWSSSILHLCCFLSGLGTSIRNIIFLVLTLPSSLGDETDLEGMSMMMSPLAQVCPDLQHLQVTGNFTPSLVAAFGEACSKLVQLRVMHGGSDQALSDLHQILPSLSHCTVDPTAVDFDSGFRVARLCTLLSCTSLTDLDVNYCTLLNEMLQALPLVMTRLQCFIHCRINSSCCQA